jgi:hypothetical protein
MTYGPAARTCAIQPFGSGILGGCRAGLVISMEHHRVAFENAIRSGHDRFNVNWLDCKNQ